METHEEVVVEETLLGESVFVRLVSAQFVLGADAEVDTSVQEIGWKAPVACCKYLLALTRAPQN